MALWAYSHKFQKIPFLREITASLLSVTSFFSIGIFYRYITQPLFIYGCFAMMIIFSREILKGIEAYKGNTIFGYGTMATWLGKKKSVIAILIINNLALLPLLILMYGYHIIPLSNILLILTLVLIFFVFLKLYSYQNERNAQIIHTLYKIFLVIIICLVVFIPE